MKYIIAATCAALLTIPLFSSEFPDPHCPTNNLFYLDGWKIHEPANFEDILEEQLSNKDEDVLEERTALDYPGTYRNDFTYEFIELLQVDPYLSTPIDYVLTGNDYVFLSVAVSLGWDGEYNDPGEYSEIRWFDGEDKHIVYNKNVQKCISSKPPLAFNSLF